MADAVGYGSWVGGDDWRAHVEANVNNSYSATQADVTVACKVDSVYGTTAGYANIQGQAACGSQTGSAATTSISQNQTKDIIVQHFKVNKTHSSQTVAVKAIVKGISGTYSGSSSTASATITVAAKTSYRVYFNANGGSGGPSASQVKWHGETLTLSGATPTRSGYTFLGWATSASATSASYSAGGKYTANATVTLYAVWKAAYVAPKISDLVVVRCDSGGDAADEGTYCKVSFKWSVDTAHSATLSSLTVSTTKRGTSTTNTQSITPSSATVSVVLGQTFSIEDSYAVVVAATDSHNLTTKVSTVLSEAFFIIDVGAGGRHIAFGMPANTSQDEGMYIGEDVYLKDTYGGSSRSTRFWLGDGTYWVSAAGNANLNVVNGAGGLQCAGQKPVTYEDKTVTVTSTAKGSNFMTSASVAKTGYTTLGVVGWWWDSGTRQNYFNAWGIFTSGNTLYVRLCNLHTSDAASGTLKVRVLYVKSEMA